MFSGAYWSLPNVTSESRIWRKWTMLSWDYFAETQRIFSSRMSKGHSVCIQTCMSISTLTGQTKVWGFWKDHWKGLSEENPSTFKKTHTNSFNLHRFSAKCSFSILSQLMLLKIHGVVVFSGVKDSVLMCATIVLLRYDGTPRRWG